MAKQTKKETTRKRGGKVKVQKLQQQERVLTEAEQKKVRGGAINFNSAINSLNTATNVVKTAVSLDKDSKA
jgi:hypothetical protein